MIVVPWHNARAEAHRRLMTMLIYAHLMAHQRTEWPDNPRRP